MRIDFQVAIVWFLALSFALGCWAVLVLAAAAVVGWL